ncbi:hypothetical protein QVD17_15038 [Tagetes erecta]|uniref:RING-type domain-containing protein n=1 Tax=Tagetes erecta TaxID=13708 RepID=A0AAD8KNY9_TARER|nr:hypothetical protein QVD17_15038 [Tagetes erecta]
MEGCDQRKRFSSEIRPPRTTACTVCMDNLYAGDKIMRLPCRHCFHCECIKQWLLCNKICPVCRRAVPSDTGHDQSVAGRIRVSHVDYRPPWGLCIDQLMELIEALFFNRDQRRIQF